MRLTRAAGTSSEPPRIVFLASHGSVISTNAQRPKPPWLLTAGTHSVRAVATLAALSFFFSPVTSTMQVEQVLVRAVAVVDAGDEVGDVVAAPRR